MSEINTPTWPDFEITIIHTGNGPEFVRATIEGRLCNVAYSDAAYLVGDRQPRYPMPALLVDSMSDLGERWANWIDDDGLNGHRY